MRLLSYFDRVLSITGSIEPICCLINDIRNTNHNTIGGTLQIEVNHTPLYSMHTKCLVQSALCLA